eukprot:15365897-Ditylum_brightwellii.AAC.2
MAVPTLMDTATYAPSSAAVVDAVAHWLPGGLVWHRARKKVGGEGGVGGGMVAEPPSIFKQWDSSKPLFIDTFVHRVMRGRVGPTGEGDCKERGQGVGWEEGIYICPG